MYIKNNLSFPSFSSLQCFLSGVVTVALTADCGRLFDIGMVEGKKGVPIATIPISDLAIFLVVASGSLVELLN